MKKNYSILLLIATLFLHSCGGTMGNIKKYPFTNISTDSLKDALNKVYNIYPELIKSDTTMYGKNNNDDFYYVLNTEDNKYVFQCNVITYSPPYDKKIDLSLTTATTWKKTMKLASKMSGVEKKKYITLFEKNILPKIKKEL